MSKVDSTVTLDPEESAEVLDLFEDSSLHPQSPKLANAVFGTARQRSITKLKEPSRRDSPTLPWRSNSSRSIRSVPATDNLSSSPATLPKRPDSPDIETILAKTPRPRRSSSSILSTPSRARSTLSLRKSPRSDNDDLLDDQSFVSDYGVLLEDDSGPDDGDGSETDSSIDIHTPLPHLMFRDGLLSPRSKLLPQTSSSSLIYSNDFHSEVGARAGSVLSLVSNAGSATTKSGLQRDPRDTHRRRMRHRDGHLLKAGMGLTTGLGWSDSEDEDAPSTLTRRLIKTTIERQRSGSITSPSHRTSQVGDSSLSRLTSPVPSMKSTLSRRATSNQNLRSASISFPAKPPGSPSAGPGTGLRIPRGRAASSATANMSSLASVSSLISSRAKSSLSLSTSDASQGKAEASTDISQAQSTSAKTPTSVTPVTQVSRARADSTTSSATSHSFTSISTPATSSPLPKTSSHMATSSIEMPRQRTDSSTSASASTTSLASTYSQYSTSSTASSGSVVPRPLRLLQTAGLKAPSHSFSQDASSFSRAGENPSPAVHYHRSRTFSNPQSRLPSVTASTQRSPTTPQSSRSGVLPPGSPHTLRERQVPAGARPRPRTGTGMAYRTASVSYISLQESANRMRLSSSISSREGIVPPL